MLRPFLPADAADLRRQADLFRRMAATASDPVTAARLASLADDYVEQAQGLDGTGPIPPDALSGPARPAAAPPAPRG